jgi:hypothetical protein
MIVIWKSPEFYVIRRWVPLSGENVQFKGLGGHIKNLQPSFACFSRYVEVGNLSFFISIERVIIEGCALAKVDRIDYIQNGELKTCRTCCFQE